jgi:hypothetical protein
MKTTVTPTVTGARSGYVIRYTCATCKKENAIMFNMPELFYHASRDATFAQCRTHYPVLTTGQN